MGQERKEDSKTCVTSVTIILLEKRFRRTLSSFKEVVLLRILTNSLHDSLSKGKGKAHKILFAANAFKTH